MQSSQTIHHNSIEFQYAEEQTQLPAQYHGRTITRTKVKIEPLALISAMQEQINPMVQQKDMHSFEQLPKNLLRHVGEFLLPFEHLQLSFVSRYCLNASFAGSVRKAIDLCRGNIPNDATIDYIDWFDRTTLQYILSKAGLNTLLNDFLLDSRRAIANVALTKKLLQVASFHLEALILSPILREISEKNLIMQIYHQLHNPSNLRGLLSDEELALLEQIFAIFPGVSSQRLDQTFFDKQYKIAVLPNFYASYSRGLNQYYYVIETSPSHEQITPRTHFRYVSNIPVINQQIDVLDFPGNNDLYYSAPLKIEAADHPFLIPAACASLTEIEKRITIVNKPCLIAALVQRKSFANEAIIDLNIFQEQRIFALAMAETVGRIESFSHEVQNDRDIVFSAVKRRPRQFLTISNQLKRDPGIVLATITHSVERIRTFTVEGQIIKEEISLDNELMTAIPAEMWQNQELLQRLQYFHSDLWDAVGKYKI